jgi:hypothetical protein
MWLLSRIQEAGVLIRVNHSSFHRLLLVRPGEALGVPFYSVFVIHFQSLLISTDQSYPRVGGLIALDAPL